MFISGCLTGCRQVNICSRFFKNSEIEKPQDNLKTVLQNDYIHLSMNMIRVIALHMSETFTSDA